ncbi:MAG: hypothetical protein E7112_00735 [Bacteroidales bacterium]|nr:hypothetical protein [Bacteroidales bacterium]
MAIDKGNIKTSANYDVRAQKPIDGRSVRPTKADLIRKESWSYDGSTVYVYEGMQVYVQDEKKTYYLKDITKLFAEDFSGWELMGTGAGSGISEEAEVYIGEEEPTDDGAKLWIDPSGEPTEEETKPEITVDTALNGNSNNPVSNAAITARFASMQTELATKQERLKSGENIKTVGGYSILGEGNIPLPDVSRYMTQAAADNRYQPKGNYQPAGDYALNSGISKAGKSGNYEDLNGKPSIPIVDLVIDEKSNNAVANSAVKAYVDSRGVGPSIYREDLMPEVRTDDFTTYKYFPTPGKYNIICPSDDHPTRIIHVDTNDSIVSDTGNIITSWCIILIDTTNGKPTDWTFESDSGMWWKDGTIPIFESNKFYVIKVHRHMFEWNVFEFVE